MARIKPLTSLEANLWRSWQTFSEAVAAGVARELAEATGLSAPDYSVLSNLIELGNGHLRQRDLAIALNWDKSRISHQLARMQERELLVRSKTVETGSRVEITALGRETLIRARPAHARAVRRNFIDRLTPEQVTALFSLASLVAPAR